MAAATTTEMVKASTGSLTALIMLLGGSSALAGGLWAYRKRMEAIEEARKRKKDDSITASGIRIIPPPVKEASVDWNRVMALSAVPIGLGLGAPIGAAVAERSTDEQQEEDLERWRSRFNRALAKQYKLSQELKNVELGKSSSMEKEAFGLFSKDALLLSLALPALGGALIGAYFAREKDPSRTKPKSFESALTLHSMIEPRPVLVDPSAPELYDLDVSRKKQKQRKDLLGLAKGAAAPFRNPFNAAARAMASPVRTAGNLIGSIPNVTSFPGAAAHAIASPLSTVGDLVGWAGSSSGGAASTPSPSPSPTSSTASSPASSQAAPSSGGSLLQGFVEQEGGKLMQAAFTPRNVGQAFQSYIGQQDNPFVRMLVFLLGGALGAKWDPNYGFWRAVAGTPKPSQAR